MNKYPNYTDTGIEWIGKIPLGWKCIKLKYITNPKRELSEDGTETLLSVTEENGIVPRSQIRSNEDHLSRSDDLKGYLKVQKGDLVNNIMLVWKRGLGVSKHDGIVSPAYSIFAFKENMNSGYFHYLLRSDEYIAEFKRNSTGIVDSRLRLYDDSFGRIFSHVPPLQKQTLISKYLDKRTSQVDSLIEKIYRKIELLKEQRTSLINQCVTKGLDPDVKMKDSVVEWIGEIPSHWTVSLLKYTSSLINKKRLPDQGEKKISPEYVESETGKITNYYSNHGTEGLEFQYGDTLLNKLRVYLSKVVFCDFSGLSMGEMIVLRPIKYNSKYQFHLISSSSFIDYLNSLSEGVKLPRTPVEGIMRTAVPLPPQNEQVLISKHLDKKISQIDSLIEKETRRIELLKEYRQSLISNVVTGKVRIIEEMI